jgi:hypothetical protein
MPVVIPSQFGISQTKRVSIMMGQGWRITDSCPGRIYLVKFGQNAYVGLNGEVVYV